MKMFIMAVSIRVALYANYHFSLCVQQDGWLEEKFAENAVLLESS